MHIHFLCRGYSQTVYSMRSLFVLICVVVFAFIIFALVSRRTAYTGSAEDYRAVQQQVAAKYKRLHAGKKKIPFREYCSPKVFKLQPQQQFASEYIRPGGRVRNLLVFHEIGAGKTCLAVQLCRKWAGHQPIVVMPASLIPGFYNELRGPCGGFATPEESRVLSTAVPGSPEYSQTLAAIRRRIDKEIAIHSYNSFAAKPPAGGLLIVDEVQNIDGGGSFYQAIASWVDKHPTSAVVVMSGTPIFNSVDELTRLSRLLRCQGEIASPEDVHREFAGKVSYYPGAPDYTFPTVYLKKLYLPMSAHQAKWYRSEVEAEMRKAGLKLNKISNDFYIKSRQRSNVVFPNGLRNGLARMTPTMLREPYTWSCKMDKLMKKLRRREHAFVYTNFTGECGVQLVCRCLDAAGWQDYSRAGPGKRRYALWTGDESRRTKDIVRAVYNSESNDDCSQIQCVIGSPAIKEGVSLLRTRSVHVLDPYWNHSRLEQIYGRAVRYCSHKRLPPAERDVRIYLYLAVAGPQPGPAGSVDAYMIDLADSKLAESRPYIDALMEVAADRPLYG
jgi:hypothetical protein